MIVVEGVGIQEFVMPVSKSAAVKLVGAGFQVVRHHATIRAGVPGAEAASLGLNFLDGFHARR